MNDLLLKKVRKIELATKRAMDDFMSGGYKSHFKGQGVQFSEHRVYSPGDDIRHLDWKVSARSKEPLVKQYEEERELNVFIIADLSSSQDFGSKERAKREVVAELGAMIAYAASNAGDKVGVLFVSNSVSKIVELKKGRNHVLRIIRHLLTEKTVPGGTNLKQAFDEARRILKHTGIVFILSDFRAEGYETALKRLAKKNDVIAVKITDPSETHVPSLGQLTLMDPETGDEVEVDPSSYMFKKTLKEMTEDFDQKTKTIMNQSKVELLPINTQEDYGEVLVEFFKRRKQRR